MRANLFATFAMLLCVIISMPGCSSKKPGTKYSAEEINYFFELAFFDCEQPKVMKNLMKWKSDISIAVTGDTIEGDQRRISDAIQQFQDLKLPIRISLASSTSDANVVLHFTGNINPKDKEQLGSTTITAINYAIEKATIEIISTPALPISLDDKTRRAVILHELMHCLGLRGHSNRFLNGTLSTNCNTILDTLDKSVIMLLYEPEIPCGYDAQDFENDYRNILVHVDFKTKLRAHVKRQKLQKVYSDIIKFGLYDQKGTKRRELIKYAFPARVKVLTDDKNKFSSAIGDAIANLNKASKNISLAEADPTDCKQSNGIFISIVHKPDLPQRVEMRISNTIYHDLKYELISTSQITLTYSDQRLVPLAISDALFNAICLNSYPHPFEEINGRISMKPDASKIIQAYYDPILPTGITDTDLRTIIRGL